MARKIMTFTLLLLCGVVLFTGCPMAGEDGKDGLDGKDGIDGADGKDYTPGKEETNAIFPVVDALSSASILRINNHTLAYVGEQTGTRYKLNKVDLDNPERRTIQDIGGNVAVITASVDGSRIALIQGAEVGYETFAGEYTKVYDADLTLLKTIPLSPPDAGGRTVEPLHHRDPSLAVTDKYVAVATEDDGFFGSGGAQQYVSVYELNSDKASHTKVFAGATGGARGAAISNIGTALMGIAMSGNYIFIGGTQGTAIYRIDNDTLALTEVAAADTEGGCHWFKDNGSYVLEPKTGTGTAGKVKVWKLNGTAAPTAVGVVDVNGTGAGSIQALSFDPDNPAKAYFYCKLAYNGATPGNAGDVYSVDLSNPSLPKTTEFKFPSLVVTVGTGTAATPTLLPLSGLWNIEKQTSGSDTYYVFSGAYTIPASGATAASTVGVVLTIKNPTAGATYGNAGDETSPAIDARVGVQTFTAPFNTAIRTLKTFKSGGDVYYAAKNYSAAGTNVFSSYYKLVLEQLD